MRYKTLGQGLSEKFGARSTFFFGGPIFSQEMLGGGGGNDKKFSGLISVKPSFPKNFQD